MHGASGTTVQDIDLFETDLLWRCWCRCRRRSQCAVAHTFSFRRKSEDVLRLYAETVLRVGLQFSAHRRDDTADSRLSIYNVTRDVATRLAEVNEELALVDAVVVPRE